jgi:hypothetical protein
MLQWGIKSEDSLDGISIKIQQNEEMSRKERHGGTLSCGRVESNVRNTDTDIRGVNAVT